jgi:LacI family repressor for deo operon, udp, cdd, tsx, nupC, and nupG
LASIADVDGITGAFLSNFVKGLHFYKDFAGNNMVGIEDVARLAGVSTATVSRALSGKEHVSERARDKVKRAASELGYVASSSAYTLATGRHRNIGVVLPFVDRWFFSVALEAIETVLIERGYDLTLYNLGESEAQRNKIFNDFLLRKRVDGVLCVAVKPMDSELDALNRTGKPVVGIGGAIAGMRTLAINDFAAAYLATEHLISLGHTRIANIGGLPPTEMHFKQPSLRHEGYEQALTDAGLTVWPTWFVPADFTIQGAYHAAKQVLGDPRNAPTAVVCASDEMGFGAIMAAKDLGLRVPEDVSVIGMDNHDMSEFFGLSTINQDVRGQGRHAAETLLAVLEAEEGAEPTNLEVNTEWKVELLIRSSTARPASATR